MSLGYPKCCSRRRFLQTVAAAVPLPVLLRGQSAAPAAPVALASCASYDDGTMYAILSTMFDSLGGLSGLVGGKTVAIKLNLTGGPDSRLGSEPIGMSHWVHPLLIQAVIQLMDAAGAARIRLLEAVPDSTGSLPGMLTKAGWDPAQFVSAGRQVEFENTNYLGESAAYSRFPVPYGGYLFPGYDLNHSYADCDVFVSLAKLKQHLLAGLTLSMKNVFGTLPCTIYGTNAGVDGPAITPSGYRAEVMHDGSRKPSLSAPQEVNPDSPRNPGYRLPRVVSDIVAARPIHLAIIDGIETMQGSEGPWNPGVSRVSPHVLIAGLNPVCTDSVGAAVMGFDPMSAAGTGPWWGCDSTLELAENAGLGTRDLSRIEVIGARIEDVRFPFTRVI